MPSFAHEKIPRVWIYHYLSIWELLHFHISYQKNMEKLLWTVQFLTVPLIGFSGYCCKYCILKLLQYFLTQFSPFLLRNSFPNPPPYSTFSMAEVFEVIWRCKLFGKILVSVKGGCVTGTAVWGQGGGRIQDGSLQICRALQLPSQRYPGLGWFPFS